MQAIRSIARVIAILTAPVALLFAQPQLKITMPAAGTVVNPGQTVTVTVSASGGPFTAVGIIVPEYIKGKDTLNSPPYEFSFTAPPASEVTPGLASIGAVGSTASGPVFAQIAIDVERSDSPQTISTNTSQLELPVGGQVPIQVSGKYADGSIVDLTDSTQTTYVSQNSGIATIIGGLVTAVAPGSTFIVVHHRELQARVKVTVSHDR